MQGEHRAHPTARLFSDDSTGRYRNGRDVTSGVWIVREGEEDAFIAAWREFASWGQSWPGAGTLQLVRDVYEPNRFMSFGPWESFEAQQAWKDDPAFGERMGRVRQHTEDFTPSVYEHVTNAA